MPEALIIVCAAGVCYCIEKMYYYLISERCIIR